MEQPGKFFLSYARKDSDFALRLAKDLRDSGHPVWVDQLDIEPGTNWDRSVEAALDACVRVIVVLSPTSVASDNVLDEIALAIDEGKDVLPVLMAPSRVPLRLRRRQHIDLATDYDTGFAQLLAALSAPSPIVAPRAAGVTKGPDEDAEAPLDPPLTTASMAVLPMRSLTDDDRTRLIAGGIHDEVTNSLSRIQAFHVVSAATTRTLAPDLVSLRQVAREFGVRYAITGSLAIAGDRLRVTAELQEIQSAKVLWDERFDEDTSDLFAVIDRVTEAIVGRLHPHVYSAEIRRLGRQSPQALSAWELVHRARMVRWTRAGLNDSIELLRRSLELDADSALAHAELARALSNLAQLDGRIDLFGEINQHVKAAMKIGPNDPAALVASCVAYNNFGRYEEALAAGSRAIELNPNHADAWACTGYSLGGLGRTEESVEHLRRGIELSPRDPLLYVWHLFLARTYAVAGEHDAAVRENREAARLFGGSFAVQMTLAVNLAVTGEYEEARAHWLEARRLLPEVSVDFFLGFMAVQRASEALVETNRAAMLAAGFDRMADDGSLLGEA
ncbi:MAG TPA: TIR domain-containing protein [Pseudomonadales bacterium]|nr:TIR domain-containing protein [Pseudomonadales bacterium]